MARELGGSSTEDDEMHNTVHSSLETTNTNTNMAHQSRSLESTPPSVPYNPNIHSTPLPAGLLPVLPTLDGAIHSDDDGHSFSHADLIQTRIIGGAHTPRGRFPYAASLTDTASMTHICGGTLIAKDIILTAGHCSGFFDSVQVGRNDIVNTAPPDDDNDDTTTNVNAATFDHLIVETHLTHPSYTNVIMNDFALAKVYGTSSVTPVRINNRRNVPTENHPLTVMGWGVTQEGSSITASDKLQSTTVDSMSNGECEKSEGLYQGDPVSYKGYIVNNMMCAWSAGKDACQGDSGGP